MKTQFQLYSLKPLNGLKCSCQGTAVTSSGSHDSGRPASTNASKLICLHVCPFACCNPSKCFFFLLSDAALEKFKTWLGSVAFFSADCCACKKSYQTDMYMLMRSFIVWVYLLNEILCIKYASLCHGHYQTLNSIVGVNGKRAWGQHGNFNIVALNNEGTINDVINSASQRTAPTKLSHMFRSSLNQMITC